MAAQGFRTDSIVLTGGLTRTPESGQIVSDVFGVAVTVPATAVEGCAWGSAVLAKYLSHTTSATLSRELPTPWPEFLGQVAAQRQSCTFLPNPEVRDIYESMFVKYKRMLDLHTQIERVMNGSGEVPP
ncbi:hypothetical protein SARC_12472 [Sphaeroforma arctica JP610]|uniref:Carbohydrate kinase FGGY C-terminal domain-containing protein n=1 Tax=Sphaeroforma arctica JP610 TaxID=667725 RepID=A0A0L0FE06_9EUKA|nr:hypothetical protein SARC_12472 [Sphaeroforma arctica JP610]KNC74994.1 hypothetical protein SARC_12472 [Sphaeroforma arctica JP610]|eukprot:XP_014148896.1 hypothetical protein SARC_12472 [Sphaeroforma arctica JP610]